MKECDILWGSKHILTPPRYFQGVRTPTNPHDLRSWTDVQLSEIDGAAGSRVIWRVVR